MSRKTTLFLRPEPPSNGELVRMLWVEDEREAALRNAATQLEECTANPEDLRGYVLAVVGAARVGKSHFLQRVVLDIESAFHAVVRLRIGAGHQTQRDLLIAILDQTLEQLSVPTNPAIVGPTPVKHLLAIRRRFGPLIDGAASDMELTLQESEALGLKEATQGSLQGELGISEAGIGQIIGFPALKVSAHGEHSAESSSGETSSRLEKVRYLRFEAPQLIRLIVLAHRLSTRGQQKANTLLVLDDFDLLKRKAVDDPQLDPEPLLRCMIELSQEKGIFVLTTARQDTYFLHEKEIHPIARLGKYAKNETLQAIYSRHVEILHDSGSPFSEEFVTSTAQRSDGRIGSFLRFMRDVYEASDYPSGKGVFVNDTVDDYIHARWSELSTELPEEANMLRISVREHSGQLSPTSTILRQPSAAQRWIVHDFTSVDSVRIDPILAYYLADGGNSDDKR